MEKQKIKHRILYRCISAVVITFCFTFIPAVLNWSSTELQLFRNSHADISQLLEVNEFTVEMVEGPDRRQLDVVWDRCANTYLQVTKNFELIKFAESGVTQIHGKSIKEDIDFNEGCIRLEFVIPDEEWDFLLPLRAGEYQLLMQLIVKFENGIARSHLVESDIFIIE